MSVSSEENRHADALVIGTTTEIEVQVASRNAPFPMNSLWRLGEGEDAAIGQVVQTFSFNRFMPDGKTGPIDRQVLDSLRTMGWDPAKGTVHVALIRLLEARMIPVAVGATVSPPDFEELAPIYMPGNRNGAWPLGVIRGTEAVADQVPDHYRELVPVWRRGWAEPELGNGIPMLYDPDTQADYPHFGIFGGSGSGKSFGFRVFFEAIMHGRQPGIILDPHNEMEFVRAFPNAGRWGRTFRDRHRVGLVGVDVGVHFQHVDTGLLMQLLQASMDSLTEHMKQVVKACFRPKQSIETFKERLEVALWATKGEPADDPERAVKLKSRHKDIVALGKSVGGEETVEAVRRRLVSLEMDGVFSATHDAFHWVREANLAKQVAVLRGPRRLLELIGMYAMSSLYEMRRKYKDEEERTGRKNATLKVYPFWVGADEAHWFAPKNPEQPSPTRYTLQTIAQEGRKYGVFLLLATQRIALLNETVTAQLTNKLVMKTVRSQDIETIKAEVDMSAEEARRLPLLKSGEGYLSLGSEGKSVPVRIRVPFSQGRQQQVPWRELDDDTDVSSLHEVAAAVEAGAFDEDLPLPQALMMWLNNAGMIRSSDITTVISVVSGQVGRNVTPIEVRSALDDLADRGFVVRQPGVLGASYRKPDHAEPVIESPGF